MRYNWKTAPPTTCPKARDNLTWEKAIELLSDIATWRRNHIKELKEMFKDKNFYFKPSELIVKELLGE